MEISRKKYRQINGMVKSKTKRCILAYLLSFSFIYSLTFATTHYFYDGNSFINTYGLVIIDIMANALYYFLYIVQYKRNLINDYFRNKKQEYVFKIPLIDKEIRMSDMINSFRICFFIIISILYTIYLNVYSPLIGKFQFMDMSDAFDYIMFFVSIAYFNVYWDGGYKNFLSNLKNIKSITENDKFLKKYMFYLILIFVAAYQIYTSISDVVYIFSFMHS